MKKLVNQPRSFIVQSGSGEYRRNRSHLNRLDIPLGYFIEDTSEEEEWHTPPQSPEKSELSSAVEEQEEKADLMMKKQVFFQRISTLIRFVKRQ